MKQLLILLLFCSCQQTRLVRATLIRQEVLTSFPAQYRNVYQIEGSGKIVSFVTSENRPLFVGKCYRINPPKL